MSGALTVLLGVAFIALSLFFKFMPRLRVVVGLVVGAMLAGVVTHWITHWFAQGVGAVSGPISQTIGQSTHAVEVALPTVTGFVLAVVVIVFLRGKGGKGGGGGGKGGGGKGGLAHAALACAVLLPIVVTSLGSVIRSVS
ncbi:hypothetical protein EV385_6617 [Krasilnikovia cinnamomea]|uniref:Uncharacterized protein n=1 Tax=Krasilnikovia cinnamomea TaxID=349313 RepID=A0A4Q7Z9K8_9ACTN|nr:hypothetical protein [Krasilnikovia cinnamomea]RZU46543.1 hypothetical protein EV385_6617 [Krasilnikovia cinnamomea]